MLVSGSVLVCWCVDPKVHIHSASNLPRGDERGLLLGSTLSPCGDMLEPPILGLDSSPKKSLQNGEHMCFCLWDIPVKISALVSEKFEMQPIDREVKMSLRWRFATERNERSKMEWMFFLVKDPWNSYEQGHHSPCWRGCCASSMLTITDVNRENVLQGCFNLASFDLDKS